MIQIRINRTKSGIIQSFTMDGHAEFADPGEDIVCAGASAVSFGTINAIEELTGFEPEVELGSDGFLRCTIPDDLSEGVQEKVQLLLEAMVVSLKTIEREYGEHIKITFKQ